MPVHVALRCDGGPATGVGHVVRSLAIGEELAARGHAVTLLGRVSGVPWLEAEIKEAGILVVEPNDTDEGLVEQARSLEVGAAVLDGYDLSPKLGAALGDAGIHVTALVDGEFGAGQAARIYVDQNLGAQPMPGRDGAVQLTGLDYSLFRDSVLVHRPDASTRGPRSPDPRAPRRVLAVFGGTDAFAAGPTLVPLVFAAGRPVDLVAIGATPALAAEIARTVPGGGQSIEVLAPTSDLAALATTCDLVVTAAGSSVWELLCLGVPTAVVCVVDNQRLGYDAVVSRDVAVGLGSLEAIRSDPQARAGAVETIGRLLDDDAGRADRAAAGMALVDGRGRARVADVVEEQLGTAR